VDAFVRRRSLECSKHLTGVRPVHLGRAGENNGVSVQHPVKVDELSFAT
jgi:hypothetical protein